MCLMWLFLLALSCRTKDVNDDTGEVRFDGDGDGYTSDEDCDDDAPGVHPNAVEICNGVDDDCDGVVDDAAGDLWYADDDGDGFGDPGSETQSCDAAEGTVADNTDCDDTAADIHPNADELCDGLDNHCDGAADTDAVDPTSS